MVPTLAQETLDTLAELDREVPGTLAYAFERATDAATLRERGFTVTRRPCYRCGRDASTGPALINALGTRHVGGCP